MKGSSKPGPVKLPLKTKDALSALLRVEPPGKTKKPKAKPRKPKKG